MPSLLVIQRLFLQVEVKEAGDVGGGDGLVREGGCCPMGRLSYPQEAEPPPAYLILG